MNSLVLAYIGDSVYELYIRKFLINKGITKVNDLQKESIKYVSAKNQARFLDILLKEEIFNKEEIDIIKRARNNKGSSHPRNTDIITYKHATGLEAIIGYLYLQGNNEKIEKIMEYIRGC